MQQCFRWAGRHGPLALQAVWQFRYSLSGGPGQIAKDSYSAQRRAKIVFVEYFARKRGLRRMDAIIRSPALTLAVLAMLLRGMLPDGWMPSASTRAPLIICPMMGGVMRAAPAHRGLPQHKSRICPFTASLAQLATVSLPPAGPVPALPIAAGGFRPITSVFAAALYRLQSPRAPPLLA